MNGEKTKSRKNGQGKRAEFCRRRSANMRSRASRQSVSPPPKEIEMFAEAPPELMCIATRIEAALEPPAGRNTRQARERRAASGLLAIRPVAWLPHARRDAGIEFVCSAGWGDAIGLRLA